MRNLHISRIKTTKIEVNWHVGIS